MTQRVAMALVVVSLLGACDRQPPPPTTTTTTTPPPTTPPAITEVVMAPLDVGTRTADFEVMSPTTLKLAPGVKLEMVEGPEGQNNGFVLRRNDGGLGGYMACGCLGATQGNCKTENDNPEHPSCSGGCTDSEGNPRGCQMQGPIIGPPKDPFMLRFVARSSPLN